MDLDPISQVIYLPGSVDVYINNLEYMAFHGEEKHPTGERESLLGVL